MISLLFIIFQSFPDLWNPKCHDGKHKVNLDDSCSVIQYLSEVSKLPITNYL